MEKRSKSIMDYSLSSHSQFLKEVWDQGLVTVMVIKKNKFNNNIKWLSLLSKDPVSMYFLSKVPVSMSFLSKVPVSMSFLSKGLVSQPNNRTFRHERHRNETFRQKRHRHVMYSFRHYFISSS